MFGRNHWRKSLLFSLMLIILTLSGSLGDPEIIRDAAEVEQHQDVLAKITSDHQVSIYYKDQNDWILTQEIEAGTKILGVFSTGEFLVIEEEGYYLGLYERDRKVEVLKREYEWKARIQLNREQKVEAVEVNEHSLAVRFQDTTDFYDFSAKAWTNERMMEAATFAPTFEPFVQISTESYDVYGMKLVGDHLLYTGHLSQMKFAKYNGSAFQSLYVSEQNSYSESVVFDANRKWLFQGKYPHIFFYADEGSGYQMKQNISNITILDAQWMELHQDYFLLLDYQLFLVYKWNGQSWNMERNLTKSSYDQFWGVKACSDGTVLTATFNRETGTHGTVKFRVYNFNDDYKIVQDLLILDSPESARRYAMLAIGDCETVILTPMHTSGNIYLLHKNELGMFELSSTYSPPAQRMSSDYYRPCVHPDGHFFIIPTDDGSDVWVKSYEGVDYEYYSTISSSQDKSCGINHELVVLGSKQVSFSVYNMSIPQIEDPPEYGKKIDVQISEPQVLVQAQRKVSDIAMRGDNLVVSEDYTGSRTYKQEAGSFSLDHLLDQSKFLSSSDTVDSLQLLVQGSYDRTAYVYKDSDSGFYSVQNISTDSQIMAVDLDADGRLLLGHMNGDITEYSWDSSVFNAKNKFPTAGAATYGVKSCPNEQIVALKEKEGWFHLELMGASGDDKQTIQLEELVGVKFAVADDCSKVFISSTMQMQVQVFVMEEGQYSLFRTVQEDFPLYDIAINPEADMFVVSRHTGQSSAVYRYDQCTADYKLEEVLSGDSDHSAVEMTDGQIALGGLDGKVAVYSYTYSLRESCIATFGKKFLSPISDTTTVTAPRSITSMEVSADVVVAMSLYSGVLLFQIPPLGEELSVTTFDDITFASSVSIVSALKTFAVGTFNKSVLVYIDSGSGYVLSQTIQTHSQVTSVDLSEDNKLLVGMMNGDLAEYSSDGSSFASPTPTSTDNSQVYAAELCPGGTKVVLLEAAGVFSLVIFPGDASEPISFVEQLQDEFIEPYLSVNQNCQIIAVSGVSMQKVQVFRKETDYGLFRTIEIGSPLSKVAVEEDGDILIVPSITSPESYVYQYLWCTGIYDLLQTLSSGTYDEATAINSQFILQGNSEGTIKISEYSYTYNTCEPIESSINVREKDSETSESPEDNSKKMLTTESKDQDQLSSQGNVMSPGIIFIIVLGSLLAFVILVALIRSMWQKEAKSKQTSRKATNDSAKQIQSQTF